MNHPRAILSDTNLHIINFYRRIQNGELNGQIVRESLEYMGDILSKSSGEYYYQIREEFNNAEDSIKFLFLNRSCFNGVMRFNSKGGFNVPFGHKLLRFLKLILRKLSTK